MSSPDARSRASRKRCKGFRKETPAVLPFSDEACVQFNTKAWDEMAFEHKLKFVPSELHPPAPVKGAAAYVIHSPSSKCSVQILFRSRAYFLKTNKQGEHFVGKGRTIAWKKYGGPKACWQSVRELLEW
jgi:hypothetical protein